MTGPNGAQIGAERSSGSATRDRGDNQILVGLLYPPELYTSIDDYHSDVAAWNELDPRVRAVAVPYLEPMDLRTRRATPGYERHPEDLTPMTTEVAELLSCAEVLVAVDLPFDVVNAAPNLRWVQSIATGVEQFHSAGVMGSDVIVTNARGTASNEIAEFVIARIFEHAKRLHDIEAAQRDNEWRSLYGARVFGSSIGLVGLGSINIAVARLAGAVGMTVYGLRRDTGFTPPSVDRLYGPERLKEMVSDCDFVVAALPETPETIGIFGAEEFNAMKRTSLFVNVGRGSAVDENALVTALSNGQIGSAAIDVASREPLPSDSPLWDTPGLHVSAHCSSVPSVSIREANLLGRDNMSRYLDGLPLRNVVSPR